jgi:hypothetical protein
MTLPKLNLRDLFWLVAVVAMGVCWWMDRQALASRFDAQQEFLRVRGWSISGDELTYDIRNDLIFQEKIRNGDIVVDPVRRTFTPRSPK